MAVATAIYGCTYGFAAVHYLRVGGKRDFLFIILNLSVTPGLVHVFVLTFDVHGVRQCSGTSVPRALPLRAFVISARFLF